MTYNSGRLMPAPKIPKLVYMSNCLLTIWLISNSLSANYFGVTIWQCDNGRPAPCNYPPIKRQDKTPMSCRRSRRLSCCKLRPVGRLLLAGRLLAGGLLACKAAAILMGGVGPATDRSRCRRVCSNFLFFYKNIEPPAKAMIRFHHVW
jgi:hypothetical protein